MSEQRLPTEQRRLQIADAALRIIGDRGVGALTMSALASEVGLTSGALFRHFASREEILIAVGRRVSHLIRDTFPPESLPPLERLTRLADSRRQMMTQHAGLARLIFSEQFSLALPDEAIIALCQSVLLTRSFIITALGEAASGGAIRTDLSPEALAPVVMGTLQHLAFRSAGPLGAALGGAEHELQGTWETLLQLLSPALGDES